jgi:hypothetical protein
MECAAISARTNKHCGRLSERAAIETLVIVAPYGPLRFTGARHHARRGMSSVRMTDSGSIGASPKRAAKKRDQRSLATNENIPSPHHRVREGPEERSSTFPCLITPHLYNASFHSTRHGRVRPLDLGLIRKKLSILAAHCARASHQLIALFVHALSLEPGPYFPARVSASAYAWSVPGRSRSIGVPATSQPPSPFSRCTSLLR